MSQTSPDLQAAIAEAGLVPGQSPSPVLLPDPGTLFARRADRLRTVATGHHLEGWLRFVADLADAQNKVVASAAEREPEQQWPVDLRDLLKAVADKMPSQAKPILDGLRQADDTQLRDRLSRLLAGHPTEDDLAAAPFLAAAEQIAWTRHAATQDAAAITPPATAHQCPVCGQPPVASMIHIGVAAGGQRYLHCGRCGTAWHHVRATCAACGENHNVNYRMIEGGDDGIRMECCDSCHSALKLLLLDKNQHFDPIADDLASLALDVLIADEGYQRICGNPFMAMGGDS